MEHIDLKVLRTLLDWRVAGRRALLATVVRTWGASPRPVGSIMALGEGGAVVGSVSGGCIEDDLVDRYAQACEGLPKPDGAPRLVRYGVSADEAHRFGLPCGGTLELLLEYDPAPVALEALVRGVAAGRLMRRTVRLGDGAVSVGIAASPAALEMDGTSLSATFGPAYRMLLIGAGPLAEYLAAMALSCGFAVTVCDPRQEHRAAWSLPGVSVTADMPDDIVSGFQPDGRSCVVALTHDPKLDDLALLEALASEAFYVGAIGSRRNNEARRARMMAHFGHTEGSLARLRGPIGIHIGSRTPPEIAVSVMAEILAVKNGVELPQGTSVAQAKRLRDGRPGECRQSSPIGPSPGAQASTSH
ncbi:XdhC family protein [Ramlibacter sp. 2FC]|uniref:XdhC family protein n=1 Tax=Ramlibacter sp. 2FC TaxID=2502188 RepID=UPI0010F7A727|nr:XdhC family protein [Ramlibacter sp. 2FC]